MRAIRLYAQVLMDVVQAPGSGSDLTAVLAELRSFSAALAESPVATKAFESPVLTEEEKLRALAALTEKANVSALARRFLGMLVKRGGLDSVSAIAQEAEALQIERKGGLLGEVVSAVELDSATLSGVIEALSKRLQKQVHLSARVDPALLGGMKVTVNGVTYDGTVRSRLDRLAAQP